MTIPAAKKAAPNVINATMTQMWEGIGLNDEGVY
jgi:hypothetical protein